VSGLGFVVDNTGDRLLFEVVTQADDNTTSFAGMRVGYKLQVSPAPATADFGDVPTSHPFFQYIEALYKSGVTGGCGGGNYCPDSNVTRGQMAVFLAKALGLQFP
jgi:S-layer family protein